VAFETDGISFLPPPAWTWDVVVTFHAEPNKSAQPLTIQVAREPLTAGDSFRLYSQRKLVQAATRADIEILETTTRNVGGRSAVLWRSRMKVDAGTFVQTLVIVDPGSDLDRRVTLFSAVVPEQQDAQGRAALEELLATVRFDVAGRAGRAVR
jgi:hypothetical protein